MTEEVPDQSKSQGKPPPQLPDGDAGLAGQARFFFSMPVCRVIVLAVPVLVIARLALGNWTRTDAITIAALLVAYPFMEWVIHVVLLHLKPRKVFGRNLELGVARNHREHHLDPENLAKNLPDTTRNLLTLVVGVGIASFALVRTVPQMATIFAFAAAALLTYEWCHFLMHSQYQPRGRYYTRLRKAHLLHHYRNERYWMGITTFVADLVLRTSPDPRTVDVSTEARYVGPDPYGVVVE